MDVKTEQQISERIKTLRNTGVNLFHLTEKISDNAVTDSVNKIADEIIRTTKDLETLFGRLK